MPNAVEHRVDVVVTGLSTAGFVVLAATCGTGAGRMERRSFEEANDGGERSWLRVPQQLGTPWALVATTALMALRRRPRDAAAAAAALPVEKGLEVLTKKLLERPRPVRVVAAELRDDAPAHGPSFPSGHSAIATASAYLLARTWPTPVGAALLAVTALSSYVRVRQGAHWPTDVVAGACLGAAVAGGLRLTARAAA